MTAEPAPNDGTKLVSPSDPDGETSVRSDLDTSFPLRLTPVDWPFTS